MEASGGGAGRSTCRADKTYGIDREDMLPQRAFPRFCDAAAGVTVRIGVARTRSRSSEAGRVAIKIGTIPACAAPLAYPHCVLPASYLSAARQAWNSRGCAVPLSGVLTHRKRGLYCAPFKVKGDFEAALWFDGASICVILESLSPDLCRRGLFFKNSNR